MNVQVLTDPFGRLVWASPAVPGATHDLTAARSHGIIDVLATAGLKCWADRAYQGAGRHIRVPFRGRRLKRWKRRHNSSHAKIRCVGEQAMAVLKGWRLLRKLRCSQPDHRHREGSPRPPPRLNMRLEKAPYAFLRDVVSPSYG